jgi:hypothetical protein
MSAKKIGKREYIKGKRKINRHPLELIIINFFKNFLIIINPNIFDLITFSNLIKKLLTIRFKSPRHICSIGVNYLSQFFHPDNF